MTRRARVDSMKPSAPGPTRTAPPRMPDNFPGRGNYLGYITFGLCGFVLYAVGFLMLRTIWVLGSGEREWDRLIEGFQNPVYILFHVFCVISLTWFAIRFFGLFPKTQPPNIGRFKRPPDIFFLVALNGGFLAVSLLVIAVLSGVLL
jgi:fumarate reductase subunit C